MESLEPVGRTLVAVGVIPVAVGAFLIAAPRRPRADGSRGGASALGALRVDMAFSRDGVSVFVLLGTMIVLSIVASVILGLLGSNRR